MKRVTASHFLSRLVFAVLMTCALMAGFAPSPSATRAEEHVVYKTFLPILKNGQGNVFGLSTAPLNTTGGLGKISSSSTKWLRRNGVLWSTIEPTPGARVWEDDEYYALEQELINASAQGYQVILVVRRAPTWARVDPAKPCGRVLDSKLSAFGNFMFDLVAKLSAPPYNVHHWELWNEPDVDPKYFAGSVPAYDEEYGCYGIEGDPRGNYGGEEYAKLLQAAYPRIKQADPNAKVYVGGLLLSANPAIKTDAYGQAGKFLRGVLAGGGGAYFDGVSYHGYDYYFYGSPDGYYANYNDWGSTGFTTGPVVGAKTQYVRGLLNEYNAIGKDLIFTEGSLVCLYTNITPNRNCTTAERQVGYEDNKAIYVPKMYAEAISQGLSVVIWHSLKDMNTPQFETFGTGLLNYDLSTRTAFQMYQYTTQRVAGLEFVEKVSPTPNVVVYKFQAPGKRVWMTWAMTTTAQTLALPSVPTAIGNPFYTKTPATSVTVDFVPLFIEWK